MTHRHFVAGFAASSCVFLLMVWPPAIHADEALQPGTGLELFADNQLIESLDGSAVLKIHEPIPREVVLITDAPWESNTSACFTVFQDGDHYRMIYRALAA